MHYIEITEHLSGKYGQPYIGRIGGEYFEARLNTKYDVKTGKFQLKPWQLERDDEGCLIPWNPVACVDAAGIRIGVKNGLHNQVEMHFREMFEKQRNEEAKPTPSQIQSSSEPCPELQTSCNP